MKQVSVAHLKKHLAACMRWAESGEDVLVTVRDRPAIRLVAARPPAVADELPLPAKGYAGIKQLKPLKRDSAQRRPIDSLALLQELRGER